MFEGGCRKHRGWVGGTQIPQEKPCCRGLLLDAASNTPAEQRRARRWRGVLAQPGAAVAEAALLPPGPRAGTASPPRSARDSCQAPPGPFSSCRQLLPLPHGSRICRAVDSSVEGLRQPADTLTPLLPALKAFLPLLHQAGASSSQQQEEGSLLPAAFASPGPQSLPKRSPAVQLRFPHAASARGDQQPQQVGHISPDPARGRSECQLSKQRPS